MATAPTVDPRTALAWRLRRHGLGDLGRAAPEAIVSALCGVQTQVPSAAALAIDVRRAPGPRADVAAALAHGRLVKTWAMRGTLHLLTPDIGPALLALIADGRSWERPSWERYFGASPANVEALRTAVDEVLVGRALTREELVEAIRARPGLGHLADALRSGWGTLLKPVAWTGGLCHGPMQGRNVTFMRPSDASPGWPAPPSPDAAAAIAITAYLRAYGPATLDAFSNWLAGGWFGKRRLRGWAADLGDRLATVEVDGEPALMLAEDLDGLRSMVPGDSVRLLPGFDQWVLGPGTGDRHVVPLAHRRDVSRAAGWIAPVAIVDGTVAGTWAESRAAITITWFEGMAPGSAAERRAVDAEVARVEAILAAQPSSAATA